MADVVAAGKTEVALLIMKFFCVTVIFLAVAVLANPVGSPVWWKILSRVVLMMWGLWLTGRMLKYPSTQRPKDPI